LASWKLREDAQRCPLTWPQDLVVVGVVADAPTALRALVFAEVARRRSRCGCLSRSLRIAKGLEALEAAVAEVRGGPSSSEEELAFETAARFYGRFIILVDEELVISRIFCPAARLGRSPCFFIQRTQRGYSVMRVRCSNHCHGTTTTATAAGSYLDSCSSRLTLLLKGWGRGDRSLWPGQAGPLEHRTSSRRCMS
jgi:hypothetical protein